MSNVARTAACITGMDQLHWPAALATRLAPTFGLIPIGPELMPLTSESGPRSMHTQMRMLRVSLNQTVRDVHLAAQQVVSGTARAWLTLYFEGMHWEVPFAAIIIDRMSALAQHIVSQQPQPDKLSVEQFEAGAFTVLVWLLLETGVAFLSYSTSLGDFVTRRLELLDGSSEAAPPAAPYESWENGMQIGKCPPPLAGGARSSSSRPTAPVAPAPATASAGCLLHPKGRHPMHECEELQAMIAARNQAPRQSQASRKPSRSRPSTARSVGPARRDTPAPADVTPRDDADARTPPPAPEHRQDQGSSHRSGSGYRGGAGRRANSSSRN